MKKKKMKHLLFCCAGNTNRSPTFERYFKKHYNKEFEVKSTGIYYGYPEQLTEEILLWADKVFVMDLSQELFIKNHFPKYLQKVEIVGISDQYEPDSPELIELIKYWIEEKKGGLNSS